MTVHEDNLFKEYPRPDSPFFEGFKELGKQSKKDFGEISKEIRDLVSYGISNAVSLLVGTIFLIGGLWMAISVSTGGFWSTL